MKYILSALLLIIAHTAFARQLSENNIRNIIIECDVADTVLRATDATAFWQLLQMTNRQYRKTVKSLRSGRDRDIKRKLITTLAECDTYFRNVPTRTDMYDRAEHTIEATGVRKVNPLATFTVTDEPDIALFGYPNGYIFASGGLIDALEGDTAALQYLLASEACHYALQHAYGHERYEKSRRRRHRALRIIGAALLTGASVVAHEASDGWFPAEIGIMSAAYMATAPVALRYHMHYTPMQIHEADIVAYRYTELVTGSGQPYIDALMRICLDLDATSGFTGPDYPSVLQRIDVLRYMACHPELRRKLKSNKSKPRPVPSHTDIFAPSNYR